MEVEVKLEQCCATETECEPHDVISYRLGTLLRILKIKSVILIYSNPTYQKY